MEKPKIGQLLVKIDKLLDRYVDTGPEAPNFKRSHALTWDGTRKVMRPIMRPVQIDQDELIGIESVKKQVIQNTRQFLDGKKANNVLLWGNGAPASPRSSSPCSRSLMIRT